MSKATSVQLPILDSTVPEKSSQPLRLPLLDQVLREQADLTAVEKFSQLHEEVEFPVQQRFYKELLPSAKPQAGQQYRFEVDLDRCTGCKACVTACHSLNGLEEEETWRMVGMLHGGSAEAPVQQTVTTACHHCLDPACMNGCPVNAYEKDPETGIVKHLDDQCIGCQYCTFTCPYEVPQYSKAKGIVRKCDMCADRLAEGEAPACVQACPSEAIAIGIVDASSVLEDAQGDAFLPGAPSPGITAPTTHYKSTGALPRNMLPADFYSLRPQQHVHAPLVLMLVLTELSVGAFCVDWLLGQTIASQTLETLRPLHVALALGLALLALGASTLHLGRPQYAFRALIGLRTSWMSREILAFGAFAGLAAAYAAATWQAGNAPLVSSLPGLPELASGLTEGLGMSVSIAGLLGVFCSAMLYHVTGKTWWHMTRTGFKFFMTAAVLGVSTSTLTLIGGSMINRVGEFSVDVAPLVQDLALALIALSVLKLAGESLVFLRLRDKQHGDLKRSALLMKGALQKVTFFRYTAGFLGGVMVPLLLLVGASASSATPALVGAVASLLLLMAGELLERVLFFAAMSAPRMPGGLN